MLCRQADVTLLGLVSTHPRPPGFREGGGSGASVKSALRASAAPISLCSLLTLVPPPRGEVRPGGRGVGQRRRWVGLHVRGRVTGS